MSATVFLGGGRITGALAAGLRLAGDRRNVHGGEIPVQEQIEQKFSIPPIIFLAAQCALSDDVGIANQ